jgi:hypothetical protein
MYQVQMQFIPGNDIAWVARLNSEDLIYEYEIEQDALDKAAELESLDITGRKYRAQKIS